MTCNFHLINELVAIILQIYPGIVAFLSGVIVTLGIIGIFRIFRKKKIREINSFAESILHESDQLYIMINNLPDSVYLKDTESRYILANHLFARMLKVGKPEDLYGKTDRDLYKSDPANSYMNEDLEILKGEKTVVKRKNESIKGHKLKVTFTTKLPVKNKAGKIIGLIGICSDITEQELAARQLEEKNRTLEKERNLLRAILDNMPDTIYVKDNDCHFLDVNPAQIEVTKAGSYKNMLGKTDYDFYPRDIADIFYKDDRHVLDTGQPVINKEEIGFDAEGNIKIRSTTKVPFRDNDGNIAGLVGIGRDISKQKETEEKLIKQAQHMQEVNLLLEERQEEINQQANELGAQNKILEEERNLLRTLIDNIPDYIYFKNPEGRYLIVNKKLMSVLNIENPDLVIGKSDFDFFPKDIAMQYLADEEKIFMSGQSLIDKEETGTDSKGNSLKLLTSKVPLKNSHGQVIGIIGISRDITIIKEAEEILKEQAGHLKEINIELEERQEEIKLQSDELLAKNEILENERNLLRTLIDALPDVIYIKDTESRFIISNKRILEVMKAEDHEQLIGKTDFDFYPKKMAQAFYNDEQQIIKTGQPLINKEELGFDPDGNELVISTTKVPFYDMEGNIIGIVGIGIDVTEITGSREKLKKQTDNLIDANKLLEEKQEEIQKQSEELAEKNLTLEEERTLLRTLIDNMPDYIYIKDRDSKFLTVNKCLMKVMHASNLDEIVGKTDFDLTPSKEAAKLYYDDERQILATGKAIINKEEIGFDEDDNERVISTSKVPFYDIDGEIAGFVGIGRDVTKQKNAEKQLREQAQNLKDANLLLLEGQEKIREQSQELNNQAESLKKANTLLEHLNATKNKFFSIIAHDLKNPFQAIFGFSELLMRNFIEFDDKQKIDLLEMIKNSSESAYNLLENLLQWARTQTDRIKYNPVMTDIRELIEQNIELSKPNAEKKQISISFDIENTSKVYIDKNMVNLVIRNLMSNAIKFTDEGGKVLLKCADVDKHYISVAIKDSGIGMSPESISRLFRIDEYFSTYGTAGETGTGLGLIICKEFIEKNRGQLTIESAISEGTTFTFTLPKSAK